jgi:hypothetical protein
VFELSRLKEMEFERKKYQMEELEKKIKREDDEIFTKGKELAKLSVRVSEIRQEIERGE